MHASREQSTKRVHYVGLKVWALCASVIASPLGRECSAEARGQILGGYPCRARDLTVVIPFTTGKFEPKVERTGKSFTIVSAHWTDNDHGRPESEAKFVHTIELLWHEIDDDYDSTLIEVRQFPWECMGALGAAIAADLPIILDYGDNPDSNTNKPGGDPLIPKFLAVKGSAGAPAVGDFELPSSVSPSEAAVILVPPQDPNTSSPYRLISANREAVAAIIQAMSQDLQIVLGPIPGQQDSLWSSVEVFGALGPYRPVSHSQFSTKKESQSPLFGIRRSR